MAVRMISTPIMESSVLIADNVSVVNFPQHQLLQIFELETEVEKLQQDVKKETTKKDTATQALRDGLEIAKAKKLECEAKVNDAEKEKEGMKKGFEMKIADLEQEVERLKSASSESDEKTVLVGVLL